MKLPRDISGVDLVSALGRMGYKMTHQTGSHIRLTTTRNGEHHVSVPAHQTIKVGTLSAILKAVAEHHKLERNQVIQLLFS